MHPPNPVQATAQWDGICREVGSQERAITAEEVNTQSRNIENNGISLWNANWVRNILRFQNPRGRKKSYAKVPVGLGHIYGVDFSSQD